MMLVWFLGNFTWVGSMSNWEIISKAEICWQFFALLTTSPSERSSLSGPHTRGIPWPSFPPAIYLFIYLFYESYIIRIPLVLLI